MTQAAASRPLLLPLVPLYRLALALRKLRLGSRLEPIRRLRFPVVSVGSLSAGGSGKTPLIIALAKALERRGMHVDVLSRGYGRRSGSALRMDPNGTAEEFGDEPLLIGREAGVPVYVATRRYEAGLMAEHTAISSSGLHLLDDGFQHRQLHRDVDILLIDDRDLQDHLLPAGNLREPLSAMRRANVLAIPAGDIEMEAKLNSSGWRGTVWRLHRRMDVPHIEGPIVAFCGIARCEQFFAGLEAAGLHLASRIAFPDHHLYKAHDLDCIRDAARNIGATAILTTEKDRVRLGKLVESLPLKTARLRIEIENEEEAVDGLVKG
ncbi:MAG: tetraacyldisaccharide 4'-kinase, partial [Terracidiphilus sp.]